MMRPDMTDFTSSLQSVSSSTLTTPQNAKVGLPRRMDLSPQSLHEEVESLRSSMGFTADSGGPSPPLPSQQLPTDQPRQHKSDKSRHTSRENSPRSPNRSCSGGALLSQSSLPLLPLLASVMGSHTEFLTRFAVPSSQTINGKEHDQGMSFSSADAAPSPALNTLSSRLLPALESVSPSGVIAESLVASSAGKDLSSPALRGGFLPESISRVESSVSSLSHSAVRLHRGRARGSRSGDCSEGSSGMDGNRNDDATSLLPLPLIAQSLTSASSSLRGRQLTPALQELGTSNAPTVLPMLSCSSSQTSMHHGDEDPCLALALTIVADASTAVGQPSRSPHPVFFPTSMHKCGDAIPIEPSSSFSLPQSSRRAPVVDRGCDDDAETGADLPTHLKSNDRGGGTGIFSRPPVLLTVEAALLTLTDDLMEPWPLQNSTTMGAVMCGSNPASPSAKSTVITPIANAGSSRFDTSFPASVEYAPEITWPPTGERFSDPKHGSAQSLDHDNCSTAARGATCQRRPSDSIENDDAVHPKRAKCRRKKGRKEGKAKRQKNGETAAEGENGVVGEALKTVAVGHKSDSGLARKRERKRQLKHEKMKAMSSEERRQYKAEHQRRRAAKKAMRSFAAADSSHIERSDHADMSGSRQCPSSPPSFSSLPKVLPTVSIVEQHLPLSSSPELPQPSIFVTAAAAAPDATSTNPHARQSSPESQVEQSLPSLSGRTSLEDLGATLSPHVLASTCNASTKTPGDRGSALLNTLQVRRCTSASGGGVPVMLGMALPAKGVSGTPAPFRRRFFSDNTDMTQEHGCKNSFLYLTSSTPAKVLGQEGQLQVHDAGAEGCGLECDAALETDDDDANNYAHNEKGGPLCKQLMNGSSGAIDVGPERASMPSRSALSPAPHPPAAAAGSGTAAILELKQGHEVRPRHLLHSPAAGTSLPAVLASVVNVNGNVASVAVSEFMSVTASASGQGIHHRQVPSVALRSDTEASQSMRPCQNQSHGGDSLTDAAKNETVAVSVSSMLCSSLSNRSRTKDEEKAAAEPAARGDVGNESCIAGRSALASVVAASVELAAARKARRSPFSSCSSFRSRSSDDESAESSTECSYSSSGSLVPEVLPLVEGCNGPPPAAAFSDLKYRYLCVPQLHSYAEPAIIHEWNLTEGCWGRVETSVVLSTQPFSQGYMRASYYMIDMRRLNCLLVAKRYLKSNVKDDQYFDDVSMHSIAGHWARVFNTMNPPKRVRFVPAAVLMLPKRNPPLILAMEPQLTGKFVKYNNNFGYVRRRARWTPQAFSHFTYHASEHELMVVDIQGVDDYYTDPQILSPDGEGYGRGNLGKEGIRRFLESHKCNGVCRAVGLPPLHRNSKGVITPLASSGSGRSSAGPGTPAGKDWPSTAATSSSGMKEERLPPKAFMLARRASSGNTPGHGHNGVSLSSRQPNEVTVRLSPAPPPRQTLHSGSGLSSLSPVVAMPSPLTPGALPPRVGPVHNYGVKYVRCPRQALIRPQSQYFVSTAAGGLMSVPQQGSGAPNGYSNGGSLSALQGYSTIGEQSSGNVGGSPANGSAGTPKGMACIGGHGGASPSPQGSVMMAVPLLRPPAGGRLGYAGCQPNTNPDGLYLLAAQKSGENVGTSHQTPHQTPHLRPNATTSMSGDVPSFYPHPPVISAVGTPTRKCISHQNSSMAVASTIQSTEDMPMTNRAGSQRHSFSRRPVFSAVEEMVTSKSKSRYQHHSHY
ncbi:Alpha-kinase family, putative [Leishmania shawi]|uniref:Alpha-kinase family n=1 Tax=Leishmania shawi TaxID=5680 RepID=A0ABR3E5Z2_9TRYP